MVEPTLADHLIKRAPRTLPTFLLVFCLPSAAPPLGPFAIGRSKGTSGDHLRKDLALRVSSLPPTPSPTGVRLVTSALTAALALLLVTTLRSQAGAMERPLIQRILKTAIGRPTMDALSMVPSPHLVRRLDHTTQMPVVTHHSPPCPSAWAGA